MDTVTWNDINREDEADDFDFRDGLLQVKASDIEAWQAEPDAVFKIERLVTRAGEVRYTVGERLPAGAKL